MCSYIKEFVHGDFGRTKPNLGQLLNTESDILQLDVEVCPVSPVSGSYLVHLVSNN